MRPENLLKLLDILDSKFFELRTRLAGSLGYSSRYAAIWLAVGSAAALHPFGRATAIAALGTYLSAALVSRATAALGPLPTPTPQAY